MLNYFRRLPLLMAIKYTFLQVFKRWVNKNIKLSFSEFGEDLLIQILTKYKRNGFYVDVGSNHPITNSTTFNLYLKGWTGINIDGNEELINKTKKIRKKDISLSRLISSVSKDVEYIKFSNDKLNSINPNIVVEWNKSEIISREKRSTQTLTEVLKEFYPNGRSIDVLSIDVEMHDFEALISLDFELFPVEIVVIEMHNYCFNSENQISKYLDGLGYKLIYFSGVNGFFKKENFKKQSNNE